jgi:nucleoside phosphorylase
VRAGLLLDANMCLHDDLRGSVSEGPHSEKLTRFWGFEVPLGREGHARVAVLTVIPEEMKEVLAVLGATEAVEYTGVFTSPEAAQEDLTCLPFIVSRCTDRSNGPASNSARNLMEDWRPETIMLVGIAGGIRRVDNPKKPTALADGPALGDVVMGTLIHFGDYGKDLPSGFLPRFLPLVHPPTRLLMRHGEPLRVNTAWGKDIKEWPGDKPPKLHMGEIVAVEAVAGNPLAERQQRIIEYFDKAIAVDMESKGVADALHDYEADVGVHYHPRWLCIRGISDLVVGSEAAAALLDAENDEQRAKWRSAAARSAATVAREVLVGLLSRPTSAHPQQPARLAWPGATRIGLSDPSERVCT